MANSIINRAAMKYILPPAAADNKKKLAPVKPTPGFTPKAPVAGKKLSGGMW